MSSTKSSLVPFTDDDSLFVRFVDTCNAAVGSIGRVERQEVSSEVEMRGLGVMIEVWTTVPVAWTFDLMIRSY